MRQARPWIEHALLYKPFHSKEEFDSFQAVNSGVLWGVLGIVLNYKESIMIWIGFKASMGLPEQS